MIALLPILLLALLDVPEEGGRRAAKNELQNRLGMRPEEGGGDLRSRLVYALSLIPETITCMEAPSKHWPAREVETFFLRWPVVSVLYQILESDDRWIVPHAQVMIGFNDRLVISASNEIFTVAADGVSKALSEISSDEFRKALGDPRRTNGFPLSVPGAVADGRWSPALPPPGLRSRLDPVLAWIVREMIRERCEPPEHEPPLRDVLGQRHLQDLFLDWFEAVHPNLSPMTFQEAWAAQDAWHRQFATTAAFRSALSGGIPFAVWPDGARLVRLATKKQCEEEGLSMGHCVGGYWSSVRESECVILSYRDPDGFPQATAEITRNPVDPKIAIRQFKGPEDGQVKDVVGAARMAQVLLSAGVERGSDLEENLPFSLPLALLLPEDVLATVARFRQDGTLPADGTSPLLPWLRAVLRSREALRRYRQVLADEVAHGAAAHFGTTVNERFHDVVQALMAERSVMQVVLERPPMSLDVHNYILHDRTHHYRLQIMQRITNRWSATPQIVVGAISEEVEVPGVGLTGTGPRRIAIRASYNPEGEGDVIRGTAGPSLPEGDGDSLFDATFCRDWFFQSPAQLAAARNAELVRRAGGPEATAPTLTMPVREAITLPLFVFLERAEAAGVRLDPDTARTQRRLVQGRE